MFTLRRQGPAVARRRVAAAAALVLALAAGVGAAVLLGGGGDGGGRPHVSAPAGLAQLAGATGSRRVGRAATSQLVKLAARLPLRRQVAQLFVVGFDGRYPRDPFFAGLRGRDWGGVVLGHGNWVDATQLAALAGEVSVVAHKAGHLPPLVAADQEGGDANAFPGVPPRAPSSLPDAPAAARDARAAARGLLGLSVNMTLAPAADVGTPGGGVENRVFGDDPQDVAAKVSSALDAYRSTGVISAVGHFPGQGAASQDPDLGTATVGLALADLRRRDLVPFRAVAARAPVIIVSNAVYAAYDGVTPAALDPQVVGGLLRRELGFRGVVMTDDLTATAQVTGESVGRTAVEALQAGADLLYIPADPGAQEQAYAAVLGAVRSGALPRARVEAALLRVLALKKRSGVLAAQGRATPTATTPGTATGGA